jgi:uncharacterized protein (TIGR01777 family)
MKILITGGTGLLGQEIIYDTLFKDDEFTILSRDDRGEDDDPRIKVRRWTTVGLDGWEKVLEGQDAVIHLAGQNIGAGLWTPARKQQILESRVKSGKILQQAILAMKTPPPIFIQASAVGFYGSRGDESLNETSTRGEGFLSDVCAAWEQSTADLEAAGVRRVILRTGVVLTPQGGILPRLMLPINMFVGGNLGSGRQYLPWLHIDDFPAIVHSLIKNPDANGTFNVCAPQAAQFEEFGKILAKLVSRPYWLPVPAFAIRMILGEMSALVLDSQNVAPERLLEMGYDFKWKNLSDAIHSFV